MSGGSMNYLYSRIDLDCQFRENTPERKAFAKHMELVKQALHDIEWVDSSDYGPGDDTAAILACLPKGAVLAEAIEEAKRVHESLAREIAKASQETGEPRG